MSSTLPNLPPHVLAVGEAIRLLGLADRRAMLDGRAAAIADLKSNRKG